MNVTNPKTKDAQEPLAYTKQEKRSLSFKGKDLKRREHNVI